MYFTCASNKMLPNEYNKIRYNLCCINFDPDNKSFGFKIDTLIHTDIQEKSISFPRPSFDGKYIMYNSLDYGNFGIWHKEADLYLLDLTNGTSRELTEVNSPYAESYHNWSSNSRWFVFESRRIDGLYTRLYIASIDENGNIGKPFLLPQKNPDYYRESLYSYNVPEFVNAPVQMNTNKVEKLINEHVNLYPTFRFVPE
jgi:dipeptidyl aminopeptidase/acylaminoacyl peptidase